MDPGVNRALQLYLAWEERQKEMEKVLGGAIDLRKMQQLKYAFFSMGLFRVSIGANEKERLYIQVLRSVVAKLRKSLYPNPVLRLLVVAKEMLVDRPLHLRRFNRLREENVLSLSSQFSAIGLGGMAADLTGKVDYEQGAVSLDIMRGISTGEKLALQARFVKAGLGSYKFTGFHGKLIGVDGAERSCFFSADSRIGLSDALSLLRGGSVLKSYQGLDGRLEQSWVKLDQEARMTGSTLLFSSGDLSGFDLKRQLLEHAIALECYAVSSDAVLRGLEKGNMVSVSVPGKADFFLRAAPFENRLEFFDVAKEEMSFSVLKTLLNPEKSLSLVEPMIFKQETGVNHQLEINR
ncbi:hypothetical protein [Pedobacter rhizosphaerae]|uniref:Uncharacterized protein n=1 Tax=Pedobacter rhizosphaerae TaxID=390241 RepID=A0A1H9T045_9SPHI|nr:hypothetical protein [Pedobacter rhizosphaerae]SER90518.1 hypothetical protein SAMN04488023_12027 [Pedobacter rhizosphaerae]